MTADAITAPPAVLTRTGRCVVLAVAFLGWFCAGMHMQITQLVGRPASIDLLGQAGDLDAGRFLELSGKEDRTADEKAELKAWEPLVGRGFAWSQCSFLFGAAAGGLVFGWVGDRLGRSKGMALSILTYSLTALGSYSAQSPGQLLACLFLTGMGVGGIWPNGVALVSEAWSNLSRPMVAGVIGTAANVGIFLVATLATQVKVTVEQWRWLLLLGASPLMLGLFALVAVPESPRWLASRDEGPTEQPRARPMREVFRPPFLGLTLIGIVLATTPVIGGWGTANWMNPWAEKAGEAAVPRDPFLKARVQQSRSFTGMVGSLLGGWIASRFGRRRTYFAVSLASLLLAEYAFVLLTPTAPGFLFCVGALGFVSGIYFGWLPLCLPELFPTRIRSTGAGVSFNFGRILTAATLFLAGLLMSFFGEDYAAIGRLTALVFLLGMVAICFAPDTSRKLLED